MKNKKLENLKLYYFFVFVLSAILIVPTHLPFQPYFMAFRFPHYLEMMKPFLGISWPMTFEIYHYGINALAIIGFFNILGILFYPKLNKIALISSFTGISLISLIVLFFFFQFTKVNFSTAVVYGFYSVVLLIVDLLTFKTLVKK